MSKRMAAGASVVALLVIATALYVSREPDRDGSTTSGLPAKASFVGRAECIDCHAEAYELWRGSDHDNAMDFATDETVLGDFDDAEFAHAGITSRFYRRDDGFYVSTEGPGGEMAEFEIRYTFGIEPLQQYLVPFPGGRLQALPIAWDTERARWFTLNPDTTIAPDDWLHWTRNGQNWNGMCAECHSTNLQKNFDAETGTFDTTWSEIDVSCEACHGPGSRHVAWAEVDPMGRELIENYGLEVVSSGLDNRQYVDMCAPCHSRRSELPDYDHSQADLLQYHVPSLLDDGLYHPDGQILEEVYVWGSFVQSKMYLNGVKCGDCHDAHSLALHQEGNALCAQCHQPGTYDTTSHHFHQKVVEGEPSDGALCIKCHMPEQPYMVIDYRADHSLRVPRPDLSESLGVPNSCSQSGCHDDQTIEWAVEAYTNWYGEARKPHYGEVLAAARAGKPEAQDGLIALVEDPLNAPIVRATASARAGGIPAGAKSARDTACAVRRRSLVAAHGRRGSRGRESRGAGRAAGAAPVRSGSCSAHAGGDATGRGVAGVPDRRANSGAERELESYISAMRSMLDFASSGLNLGNLYEAQGDTATAEKYYRQSDRGRQPVFPGQDKPGRPAQPAGRGPGGGVAAARCRYGLTPNSTTLPIPFLSCWSLPVGARRRSRTWTRPPRDFRVDRGFITTAACFWRRWAGARTPKRR